MPTERGYVEKLGIGRAGLVEACIMHTDNSSVIYTIADLDADPERFNERLSKLAILRDAMDRAEPVEIEFQNSDDVGARNIDSVMRITRDTLRRELEGALIQGVIVAMAAQTQTVISPKLEAPDRLGMFVMTKTSLEFCQINMQMPERPTARTMSDIARDAYRTGATVTIGIDAETFDVRTITLQQAQGFIGSQLVPTFSAFVEEITHTQFAGLMRIDVTTAPEFQGDGNIVPLDAFIPERRVLAVIYQSPEYELLEAALRDKLRVELVTSKQPERDDGDDTSNDVPPARTDNTSRDVAEVGIPERNRSLASMTAAVGMSASSDLDLPRRDVATDLQDIYMLRGVTLQHALCSATRPVWIEINRRALDIGPDAECVDGLPSNDMRPQTIRELNLPYQAAWIGTGCFNHGVYRIQLMTDRALTIWVDSEEICLHTDAESGAIFGHACLNGDHEVRIELENWQCKAKFDIDVYRIR